MKDWEVRKVNELYEQIDRLKAENRQLQQIVDSTANHSRLDNIDQKLDQLLERLPVGKTKRPTSK